MIPRQAATKDGVQQGSAGRTMVRLRLTSPGCGSLAALEALQRGGAKGMKLRAALDSSDEEEEDVDAAVDDAPKGGHGCAMARLVGEIESQTCALGRMQACE